MPDCGHEITEKTLETKGPLGPAGWARRRTDLRDPELLDRLENSRIDPNGQLDRVALAADYEWFRQYAGLAESVNLNDVVDASFAYYAVSLLGQYR